MKDKIQNLIYKMNFRKTWPYFTAIGFLFAICCIICECLAFAVEHHEELSFLDDELALGISNYTAVYFLWGFLIVYLLCRLIEHTFKFFLDCISKRIRKDD